MFARSSRIATLALLTALLVACSAGGGAPPGAAPAKPAAGGAAPAPAGGVAKPAGGAAAKHAGDDASAQLYTLYEAARREGRVILIGPSATDQQGVFDAFQQKYSGIRVQPLTARGPEMIARLDSEIASGQRQIGVFATALSTMYTTQKAGRFEPFDPPSAKGLPERYRESDNSFHGASATPYGILYNTNLVRPDEAPQSWQDLLDPKWRGKIIADDPRTAGGGQITMVGFTKHPELGWPYVETLAGQQIRFSRDRAEIPNAVARGEYPLAYPVSVRDIIRLRQANAPVELVLPRQGACECATGYVGAIQGGPHPNASKLLVDFYFTDPGQKELAERGDFPAMPGQAGPSGFPPLSDIPLLPQLTKDDIDGIDRYITRFDAIFAR
jgi:iron(III) transport system substrate-binding protein